MRVDLRGTHIGGAEEFLDRPDIVARFEQVGREREAETAVISFENDASWA